MKKRTALLILAACSVLQVRPSHDEDLWAAAPGQGPSHRRPPRGQLLQAARRGGRWPWPRSRARWTRSIPTPTSSTPRASPGCARTTRASTSASGMQIQKQGDAIVVIAPIEGGPAWRLGIQPGDVITHIDGEIDRADLRATTPCRSSAAPKGTKVTVTFVREGAGQAVRPDHHPRGDPAPERPVRLPPRRRRRLRLRPQLRRGRRPDELEDAAGQAGQPGHEEPHPRPAAEHAGGPLVQADRDVRPVPAPRARSSSP
ncbi:MAG: PDZ domain-containing protein [Comamonadaceae bacterium]|nr:PDZ domain-containing protein [Comamonadaceae bacterium]